MIKGDKRTCFVFQCSSCHKRFAAGLADCHQRFTHRAGDTLMFTFCNLTSFTRLKFVLVEEQREQQHARLSKRPVNTRNAQHICNKSSKSGLLHFGDHVLCCLKPRRKRDELLQQTRPSCILQRVRPPTNPTPPHSPSTTQPPSSPSNTKPAAATVRTCICMSNPIGRRSSRLRSGSASAGSVLALRLSLPLWLIAFCATPPRLHGQGLSETLHSSCISQRGATTAYTAPLFSSVALTALLHSASVSLGANPEHVGWNAHVLQSTRSAATYQWMQ